MSHVEYSWVVASLLYRVNERLKVAIGEEYRLLKTVNQKLLAPYLRSLEGYPPAASRDAQERLVRERAYWEPAFNRATVRAVNNLLVVSQS